MQLSIFQPPRYAYGQGLAVTGFAKTLRQIFFGLSRRNWKVNSSGEPPTVSVIIATYNYSSVLRYAISSVLWQTFKDFELIVVGDCCTDDSETVARSFNDQRIHWLNLPENSGSKALPQNAGIRISRGKYIAYLAHDDLWHPLHLETVLDAIDRSDADLVYSVALYVPPPGSAHRVVSGIFPEGHFRSGYALVHSTTIHKRSLTDDVGDWPDFRLERVPGDHVFWTRAIELGKRFVGIPKVTVWKFNASSRPDCYVSQRCDEQARYFEMIRDDPSLVERELIALAQSAMQHGLEPLRTLRAGRDAPAGSHITFLRQVRGLEPREPMQPLALAPDANPFRIQFAEKLPGKLRVGEWVEVEVRIENNSDVRLSSDPPAPVNFSYHWLHPDGSMAILDGMRTRLIPSLLAHSSLHYFVKLFAPGVPGNYRLHPALIQEGVRWLDEAWREEMPLFEITEE